MKELYCEQLGERPKPEGRTGQGWARILKGLQDQFDERVDKLHTVIEVHSCALRALKDSHLREVYIGFCAEDTAEFACSNSLVESIVYAPEEHPDFHKDLELYEQTSSSSFGSPCKDLPIPLILPRLQGCEGIVGYETGKLLQLLKLVAEAVAAAAAAVSAVDLQCSASQESHYR